MKNKFNIGDRKLHLKMVEAIDFASFDSGLVHPVCSTYVLAREMEWASRLFVLDMLEDDEEGIGTKLEINHLSPALEGEELRVEATISSVNNLRK
jgi:fluoroacetyl-CoA thioesterase